MKIKSSLRSAMSERVIIADGAMGTMLQEANPSLEDFQGHEGCNEILNVSKPELVKSVHRRYLEVGVDAIETNTFGAKLAKEVADEFSTNDKPRWVLGSLGPGTKLPTLLHTDYLKLKDAYRTASDGLLDGGVDALLIETTQDLLQAKAAINGAREAIDKCERDIVLIAQVTVEATGTMLLGSEIGAALNALEPLNIDLIGLNCATGPAEMSEHLRVLAKNSSVGISVMPNAGLPQLGPNGATYPLGPDELAEYLNTFVDSYGLTLVGGCCGTTPAHMEAVVKRIGKHDVVSRKVSREIGASSLYQFVPFRQDLA